MVDVAALRPFLEARSAVAGRAFGRPPAEAGLALSNGLSDALDVCLRDLAEPVAGSGAAVVALGSYGRRELCRHSDVDLMLLFAGEPDQDVVNRVLYPLWDSGLQVGHSTRRLQQVVPAARDNVQTCTSLLDARLVSGDETLFRRFRNELRNFVRRRRPWMHEQLAAGREAQLRREPWQPQEPDVKTGRGGLRSLQTVHWLDLSQALADDREVAWLTPELAEARELLLATRNALHALDERANDRLRRDVIDRVADSLGTTRREWSRGVTEAMRAVDAAAAEALRTGDSAATGPRWRLPVPWRRRRAEDGEEATAGAAGSSDFDRLVEALQGLGPGGPLDPLPAQRMAGARPARVGRHCATSRTSRSSTRTPSTSTSAAPSSRRGRRWRPTTSTLARRRPLPASATRASCSSRRSCTTSARGARASTAGAAP